MIDVGRVGRALRFRLARTQIRTDGLVLQRWFREPVFVPWIAVKGMRVADRTLYPGRLAPPGGNHRYRIQVKFQGEWHHVGRIFRVREPRLSRASRVEIFGERARYSPQERAFYSAYEAIHELWVEAGGTPSDEDDNRPQN